MSDQNNEVGRPRINTNQTINAIVPKVRRLTSGMVYLARDIHKKIEQCEDEDEFLNDDLSELESWDVNQKQRLSISLNF